MSGTTTSDTQRSFGDWEGDLYSRLGRLMDVVDEARVHPVVRELGIVGRVDGGIVTVRGLPGVQSEELVRFPHDRLGMAYDLNPGEVGVILLDEMEEVEAGAEVRRTGEVMSVPVGDAVVGRVIDPTGRPLDGRGPVTTTDRLPIERPAPGIMERSPVEVPLQTGIKAVDALIPIGRGQRELIVGDRQTGKTAVAVDTIINQAGKDVVCIYCTVGMRSSGVAKLVDDLRRHGALEYTAVVVTTSDDPAGRQFIAPYAATSMAEYFRDRSRDVLIVYDDLTRHARAYRELSLLLRRPPGREAYPGDIFYIHSRLLERPARLGEEQGGGSVTALPIVETEAENISAYIPTNLISITDGQLYLSPRLFRQGVLPAIDIGRSVSRVGGKAQLSAYRSVAGDLRLSYSQFEELERFSRYGARLERGKAEALERGRRVREVLKQGRYQPLDVGDQIAQLAAVTGGVFDGIPVDRVPEAASVVGRRVSGEMSELFDRLRSGGPLGDEELERMRRGARDAVSAHLSGAGQG